MQSTIRSASIEDLGECFRVQKAADLAAFPHIFPPEEFDFPDDAVRERWQENLTASDRLNLIAETDGVVTGCACLLGDVFDSIAVVPEHWGQGTADLLYVEVLHRARSMQIRRLNLWVMRENLRARRFYERRGWQPNGGSKLLPFPPHPEAIGYTLSDLPDQGRAPLTPLNADRALASTTDAWT